MKIDTQAIKNTILNFIVPIAALGIAVLLVLVVIIPTLRGMPGLQESLRDARDLEATLRTKLDTLDRLVDFRAVVEEDGVLFSRALTDEPMVPELLTQIDQIARESGLAVTKLNYSITDAASLGGQTLPYNIVVVNLGTLGTYDQVTTFLARLEEAARLVDTISFRYAAENSAGEGVLASTFILSSPYRFVSSKAVTDVPIQIDVTSPAFSALLEKVKALRFYNITASTEFTEIQESPVEQVIETLESTESTASQ